MGSQLCKFLPTFHSLHQILELMTMRLLVVVVLELKVVEVLSNEKWA